MKVIIINGSARKGNTLTAIEAFVKGASEKNEIEIIEPDKLNIAPCKGCGVCQCSNIFIVPLIIKSIFALNRKYNIGYHNDCNKNQPKNIKPFHIIYHHKLEFI